MRKMLLKMRKLTTPFALVILGGWVPLTLSYGIMARADSSSSRGQLINKAFVLSLSPRGQRYFADHLTDLFAANGFEFDQGEFPSWKYAASEPIRLDNLPMNFSDVKTTLGSLRDLIQKWLGGFQLKDPLFTVVANGIHYSAQFRHFGLVVDPDATQRLGNPNAIVVDLGIDITRLEAGAEQLLLNDANNPDLGQMGMNEFDATTAQTDANGNPIDLSFNVPLEVEIDPDDGFTVQALAVETDLASVPMDWTYSRPMQLPQITVSLNGTQMNLDYTPFEDQIVAHERDIAKSLQTYLQQYLAENGATMINSMLKDNRFTHITEETNDISPVGVPDKIPGGAQHAPNLKLDLVPAGISFDGGTLTLSASSSIQDPEASESAALPSDAMASSDPVLDGMSPDSYDLALSINEGFFNRLLQLSYERGYFKNMNVKGTMFTLNEAPYIRMDSSLGDSHLAKMHISMDYVYNPTSFWDRVKAKIAVHNPVKTSFDIITHVVTDASGDITFTMKSIDVNSAAIDPSSARFDLQSQVLAGVKAILQQKNSASAGKESPLAPPFKIPGALFGVPVKVLDVQTDSTGHFNAFVQYGGQS